LRVIKKNNAVYESFYRTVPYLDKSGRRKIVSEYGTNPKANLFFNELFRFHTFLNNVDDEITLTHLFQEYLRRIINFKETGVLLFNEDKTKLIPAVNNISEYSINYLNNTHNEGILDWIFENEQHTIIPDFNLYYIKGPKLNYIVYPVKNNKEKTGLFFLLTTAAELRPGSTDDKYIQVILNSYTAKLEGLKKEEERKKAYDDMMQYQGQFMNNYKLAAIGELTSGITEDVLSSLQIILSLIDLDEKEGFPLSRKDITSIKNQVNKVEQIIKGIVKFGGVSNKKTRLYPCNLNKILSDYYELTNSTLKNNNHECVLDLSPQLPNFLTDPAYINQILSNIFGIISESQKKSVGILIQTRYLHEHIHLKFLITEAIKDFKNPGKNCAFNIQVINNLMKLHEGEFKADISAENGTIVQIKFPIKRRLK
jgi:hypothetical protein